MRPTRMTASPGSSSAAATDSRFALAAAGLGSGRRGCCIQGPRCLERRRALAHALRDPPCHKAQLPRRANDDKERKECGRAAREMTPVVLTVRDAFQGNLRLHRMQDGSGPTATGATMAVLGSPAAANCHDQDRLDQTDSLPRLVLASSCLASSLASSRQTSEGSRARAPRSFLSRMDCTLAD